MSNLDIFDHKRLELLLEPFVPGMAARITPIKYEAHDLDHFYLLFRTSANNGYRYFIVIETNFKYGWDMSGPLCDIESWYGNGVIAFQLPYAKRRQEESENIEDYRVPTRESYFALLAEVERPTHKGYWAEAITIAPSENIGEKIKQYPKEVQAALRKTLADVLRHDIVPDGPFLEAINVQKQGTMTNDINQTNMKVSLYPQPDGSVESSYEYIRQDGTHEQRKSTPRKV